MLHRIIKLVFSLLVVLSLLAGCAPAAVSETEAPLAAPATEAPPEPTAVPTQAEPDVVQVGFLPVLSMSPFFIAEAEGFFTEQNITYEWQSIETMADAVPLLAAGTLDVSAGSINSALINATAGGEAVAVVADKGYMNVGYCPSGAIIGCSEILTSGVLDSAETVRSLTYAGNTITTTAYVLDQWLNENYGLSINDINTARIPNAA